MSSRRLDIVTSFDTEFLHFGVQRGALESQTLSCSIRTANLALGIAQDTQDVFAFRFVQGGAFKFGYLVFCLGLQLRQRNIEYGATSQDDGPLKKIFKLANIAGPWQIGR